MSNNEELYAEISILRERLKLYEEYVKLLLENISDMTPVAWVHGFRTSDEQIAKAKEIRKKLGVEEK